MAIMLKNETENLQTKNEEILKEFLSEKFPWCVKDGKISIQDVEQLLTSSNILPKTNMYGLNWPGKDKLVSQVVNKPISNTLIPLVDKSVNFESSDNIYIEGENLDVLKIMQKHYCNQIDVIYIDPPYNTGNDFVYNDDFDLSNIDYDKEKGVRDQEGKLINFVKNDGGKKHTNWLNMMYPRLVLARSLLKDDGVIFISIDDNEYSHLKDICDEIFGEENFVVDFVWRKKNTGGGSDKSNVETETENVLCYSKNINNIRFNRQKINTDNYTLMDEYYNQRGKYNLVDLDRSCSKSSFQYIESLDYEIQAPDGTYFKNCRNELKPKSYRYTVGKKLFDFLNANGFIVIKKNKDEKWRAYRKSYEKVTVDREKLQIIERLEANAYSNLINIGSITTSAGKRELIQLLNDKDFSFPKPSSLIKFLINLHKNKNAIIFDFFSGSATTAHAVLELNQEDGGNRKFILAQLQEKIDNEKYPTICDIGETRIKKVIEKLNTNGGFRIFKVSEGKNIFDSNTEIDLFNIDENKTIKPLDLLFEIIINNSKNFDTKYLSIENDKLFNVEHGKLLVITSLMNNNLLNLIEQNINDNLEKIIIPDWMFENDLSKIEYTNKLAAILEKHNKKDDLITIYVG